MPKKTLPENLNDMEIGVGPFELSYGASHSPSLPDDAEAPAAFAAARTAIVDAATQMNGLELLAALAMAQFTNSAPGANQVHLAEVEFGQALILTSVLGRDQPKASAVKALCQDLKLEMHLFLDQTARPPQSDREEVLRRRQRDTLYVRHTLYPSEVHLVQKAVATSLGETASTQLGLSFGLASGILFTLANLVGVQVRQHADRRAVQSWLEGEEELIPAEWLEAYRIEPALIPHIIPEVDATTVERLMAALSLSPGDLAAANLDHLHLDNPVWGRPFVKAGDEYYLFVPETIYGAHSDQIETIAALVLKKPKERLGKARGEALETLLNATLHRLLPSAEHYNAASWTDPSNGQTYETDALCLIDGVALIFEAKGDALSAKGKRGSQTWFADLDDIVIKAAVQASRLAGLLLNPPRHGLVLTMDGQTRVVQPSEICHVVRFGVALERVTTTSYGLAPAVGDRIRAAGAEPMPSVTIGDLIQLEKLIPGEPAHLHYLLRRHELEADIEFVADELDLLALYLRTSFAHLRVLAGENGALMIYGLSDLLRFYQEGMPYYDPRVRLPRRLTSFWSSLVADLERRKPRNWVSAVYDLLNVGLEGQQRFEADIAKARKHARRRRPQDGPLPAVMSAPFQLRPSAFVCYAVDRPQDASRTAQLLAEARAFYPAERLFIFELDAQSRVLLPRLTHYDMRPWSATT